MSEEIIGRMIDATLEIVPAGCFGFYKEDGEEARVEVIESGIKDDGIEYKLQAVADSNNRKLPKGHTWTVWVKHGFARYAGWTLDVPDWRKAHLN